MKHTFRLIADGFGFIECPRWHAERLWFSDFNQGTVFSVLADGTQLREEATVPAQPLGLGWLPDGRLLIVATATRQLLRREFDGSLSVHADLSTHAEHRLNEMVVDVHGRAYVGEFGFDALAGAPFASARLLRVDPDGSVHPAASGLHFPNGSVITNEGQLLVNETFGNRISAFDLAADGSLHNHRIWAQFAPTPDATDSAQRMAQTTIGADGCCLDAEGALWVADAFGGRVLRVRAGGQILDEIKVAGKVFACMLGGNDGKTLFLCESAVVDQAGADQTANNSYLSALEVSVGRAGRP